MRTAFSLVLAVAVIGGGVVGLDALGDRQEARARAEAWERRLAPPRLPTEPERVLGRVAARIAGRPVTVLCEGAELPGYRPGVTTHGVVWFFGGRPASYAVLAPNLCRELLRLHGAGLAPAEGECLRRWAGLGCGDRIARLALAAATLAHESFHLRGVQDEAAADCYAIQAVELVGLALGLEAAEADGLGAFVRADHRVGQAGRYVSRECREGGRYDLARGRDGGLG